jgi:hypothetical protein
MREQVEMQRQFFLVHIKSYVGNTKEDGGYNQYEPSLKCT